MASKRPVRICVTGGRRWTDRGYVWRAINKFELDYNVEIIELGQGEAEGVDKFCKEWAEAAIIPTRDYKADWDRHGEAAGGIRNEEMLLDFKPDYLLVFPGHTGTTNCTRHARKMKIERVFSTDLIPIVEDPSKWG